MDYKKALRELHRILSPGGRILISFLVDTSLDTVYEDNRLTSPEERILHFGQNDHLRVFGRDGSEMLRSYGFEIEEIRGEAYPGNIKPVIGAADYDSNVMWGMGKR